jgi:hypothetical protein
MLKLKVNKINDDQTADCQYYYDAEFLTYYQDKTGDVEPTDCKIKEFILKMLYEAVGEECPKDPEQVAKN